MNDEINKNVENNDIMLLHNEKNENKKYDDFVERKIIVNRNNFIDDNDNFRKYFLEQVTYPFKGVNIKFNKFFF
jgi:hypothetical protein